MKNILLVLSLLTFLNTGVLVAQSKLGVTYYNNSNDTISFNFKNNSSDTLYLFSTYFLKDLLSSKYLHKIDKKNKIYKVSYVPLLRYLSAYLTDRIVLGEDRIVVEGQNKYKFEPIAPNGIFTLKLAISDVFNKMNEKNNVVKDFTDKELSKKKFKFATYDNKQGSFDLIFEFAYYKSVDLLTSKEKYINAGDKAHSQAAEYDIVQIRTEILK